MMIFSQLLEKEELRELLFWTSPPSMNLMSLPVVVRQLLLASVKVFLRFVEEYFCPVIFLYDTNIRKDRFRTIALSI